MLPDFGPPGEDSPGLSEPPQVSGPADAGVFRLHSRRRAGCASRIHKRDRHLVADGAVSTNLVVVSTAMHHLLTAVVKWQVRVVGARRSILQYAQSMIPNALDMVATTIAAAISQRLRKPLS